MALVLRSLAAFALALALAACSGQTAAPPAALPSAAPAASVATLSTTSTPSGGTTGAVAAPPRATLGATTSSASSAVPAPTVRSTAATTAGAEPASPLAGYGVVADIPLLGGTSRFDYQSLDPQGHRLVIAHLGASAVLVFDTQRQQVTQVIPNVAGVHGVLIVPQRGRIYATASDKDQVAVFDDRTGAVIATVPTGRYPDGLAYDPDDGKLFVSNEAGGTDTVIDASSNRRLADIALGGDVGNTQYASATRRVYVAVGARNQLAAIDPTADKVVGWTDLPGCQHPHGLALDPNAAAAYVACDGNARLLGVDLRAGQVRSTQAVGDGPDVLALDPSLRRLYVAAESGVVSVFRVDGATLQKQAEARVAPSAHTVAVDPATHRVYLPLENVGGKPMLRVLAPPETP